MSIFANSKSTFIVDFAHHLGVKHTQRISGIEVFESSQEFIVVWNYHFLDLSQYRHLSLCEKTGVGQQIVKTLHVNEEKCKEVHQQSEQTDSALSIRRKVRIVQMFILSVFIEASFRYRCT